METKWFPKIYVYLHQVCLTLAIVIACGLRLMKHLRKADMVEVMVACASVKTGLCSFPETSAEGLSAKRETREGNWLLIQKAPLLI